MDWCYLPRSWKRRIHRKSLSYTITRLLSTRRWIVFGIRPVRTKTRIHYPLETTRNRFFGIASGENDLLCECVALVRNEGICLDGANSRF